MKKKVLFLIIGTIYSCFSLVNAQIKPDSYYKTNEYYKKVDSLSWARLFNDQNRKKYRDSLKVTDWLVDSIFIVEKIFYAKSMASERDTSTDPGEKFVKRNILKDEEKQNLKQLLADDQYQKWVEMHTIKFHSSIRFDTSAGYRQKLDSLVTVSNKRDKEAMHASDAQMDSLHAINHRYIDTLNKISGVIDLPTTSLTEKQRLYEQYVALSNEQQQKQKEILTEEQYNKWVKLHIIPLPETSPILQAHKQDLRPFLENMLMNARLKNLYKDSLQATDTQADSLLAINDRYGEAAKRISADSSITKKERITKLLAILRQKNERVKAVLDEGQYKKWQQWESDRWKKRMATHGQVKRPG